MNRPDILPYATSAQVGGVTVQRDGTRTTITVDRVRRSLRAFLVFSSVTAVWLALTAWWALGTRRPPAERWIVAGSFGALQLLILFVRAANVLTNWKPLVWTVSPEGAVVVVRRGMRTIRERYPALILTELSVARVHLAKDLWGRLSLFAMYPNGKKLVLLRARRDELLFVEQAMREALRLPRDPLRLADYAPVAGRIDRSVLKQGLILSSCARWPVVAAAALGAIAFAVGLAVLVRLRSDVVDTPITVELVAGFLVLAAWGCLTCGAVAYSIVRPLRPVETVTLDGIHLMLRRDGLGAFEVEWPAHEVAIVADERGGIRFTPRVGQPVMMFASRPRRESVGAVASLKVAYGRLRDPGPSKTTRG